MKKIAIVFGTRPEAIKMAPLIIELENRFDVKVWVTAQHRGMLDQVLELFEVIPDLDLDIMKDGQDLFDISSRILLGLKKIFKIDRPDCVLVHGDTSTSLMAAISAFYEKIPVGHVEAGLRTYNVYSPFPEEMNRQLTSKLANFHFAPTKYAKKNLLKENIEEQNIYITGNTVVDSLHYMQKRVKKANFSKEFLSNIHNISEIIDNKKIILVTGHRRENFGEGFENICRSIKKIANEFKEVQVIYPVHLNPNVLEPVHRILQNSNNVSLIDPVEYSDFIKLMDISYLILTDSGGIQEEAPSFGKPVLLMRDTTERPEALNAGTVVLTGTNEENIYNLVKELLIDKLKYESMVSLENPFGDGQASKRISDILNNLLNN